MGNEDGVALCLVELSVRRIADLHARKLFAVFECELRDHMDGVLSRHFYRMPSEHGCKRRSGYPGTHAILPRSTYVTQHVQCRAIELYCSSVPVERSPRCLPRDPTRRKQQPPRKRERSPRQIQPKLRLDRQCK